MKPQTPSSKPFEALATGLTAKYRRSPSTRMTVQLVLLQICFTIAMITLFSVALQHTQADTISSISRHVTDILDKKATSTDSLAKAIDTIQNRMFLLVATVMVLLNMLFAFLIARLALRPAQDTLTFQKRFIGNIAHELRTPLSIIKTSTEVALFDPTLPRDIKETLDETLVELDRISETINNLLSFNTLTKPTEMKFAPVDVSMVLETVVARHQELADSRKVRLHMKYVRGSLVLGNATALDQVITNLVKNAINYTPKDKDKVVEAILTNTSTEVVLTVRDSGIGIKEEDIHHIFEPFYRGDTSRARGIGTGTSGLGLAIVYEIVKMHNGSITIRSTPGKGTTVRVVLPRTSASS